MWTTYQLVAFPDRVKDESGLSKFFKNLRATPMVTENDTLNNWLLEFFGPMWHAHATHKVHINIANISKIFIGHPLLRERQPSKVFSHSVFKDR